MMPLMLCKTFRIFFLSVGASDADVFHGHSAIHNGVFLPEGQISCLFPVVDAVKAVAFVE